MPRRTRLALWSIGTGTSRSPCHSPKPYFAANEFELSRKLIQWWSPTRSLGCDDGRVRSHVPTHERESRARSPGFAGTIADLNTGVWKLSARRERGQGWAVISWYSESWSRPGPAPGHQHSQSVRGCAGSIRCELWPTVTIIPCAATRETREIAPKASQTGYFSLLVSRPSQSVDAQQSLQFCRICENMRATNHVVKVNTIYQSGQQMLVNISAEMCCILYMWASESFN